MNEPAQTKLAMSNGIFTVHSSNEKTTP